jgi:UPF0755 protein
LALTESKQPQDGGKRGAAQQAGAAGEPRPRGGAPPANAAAERLGTPSAAAVAARARANDQGANSQGANSLGAAPRPAARAAPRSRRGASDDRVEPPARRSARARHPLVIAGNAVISILLILMVAGGYVFYVGKQRFEAPGPLQQDTVVNIPRGSGIRDISSILYRDGVIDQPWVFIGGVLMLKAREGLKAGEYAFRAHASLSDVVATLSEGKVVLHQITVPEGLTSEQIVAHLMDDDVLAGNIDEVPAEGSLLPDTYSFTRGITREQIIRRMQRAQQSLLADIWARRTPDLPLKTPQELVILASMVEKETARPDERTRIAAVFVNRLKQKMRLQSDPTIIYGLVGGKGSLGRPIMKSEIDQPTPYNTYQIDGLPPGPITNPGRAALEAAANPARTRDLYFVAEGNGGHLFAETYEQHQKNVLHLRQLEVQQKNGAVPDTEQPAAPNAVAPTPPQHATAPKHARSRRVHGAE